MQSAAGEENQGLRLGGRLHDTIAARSYNRGSSIQFGVIDRIEAVALQLDHSDRIDPCRQKIPVAAVIDP